MMLYQHKAIQVTPNVGKPVTPAQELAQFYPYPKPSPTPYVRANMIASIDGAATSGGLSGGLGGPGDRAVFRALRGLADVVLVGARTALAEQYRQPAADTEFAAMRTATGQSAAPILALVSRSLAIDPRFGPLADPATLILTCVDAPDDRRETLSGVGATLLDCGTDTVDPTLIVKQLAQRGLTRVLCEGGPSLLASLITAGLLDELCLTTSPHLVASDAPRIAHGPADTRSQEMRIAHVLSDDDGYVFARWVRQ